MEMEVDELARLSSHGLRAETELSVLANLDVDIGRSTTDERKDADEVEWKAGGLHTNTERAWGYGTQRVNDRLTKNRSNYHIRQFKMMRYLSLRHLIRLCHG